MTARDFCFWLQGYFEITSCKEGSYEMTDNQIDMIKKHLKLVFVHDIDPSMGDKQHQLKLNNIHNNPEPLMRC